MNAPAFYPGLRLVSPGGATCTNVFKVFPVILDLQEYWKASHSRHKSEYMSSLWRTGPIFGCLSRGYDFLRMSSNSELRVCGMERKLASFGAFHSTKNSENFEKV